MAQNAFDRLFPDTTKSTQVWAALSRLESGKTADTTLEELWESLGSRKSDLGLQVAIDLALNTPAAVQPFTTTTLFSAISRLSDATAMAEMVKARKLQIVASSFGSNEDFTRFMARKRWSRQNFQYTLLECLSEMDAARHIYCNTFVGLLRQIHERFLGLAEGSRLAASMDQLLGTSEPFRPDVNWASAIQQPEMGANDGWRLCKGLVEVKASPMTEATETAAKLKLVTESEAIAAKRLQMNRQWKNPLPALITDGRIVLGATITPAFGGHTMDVTGRCALANPDGQVDPYSLGFTELLYFVWVAERIHIRGMAEALYEGLADKPGSLLTPSGSMAVSVGKRLGLQTFACSTQGTPLIMRVGLPEPLLHRATEAELHAFSQADNEMRFLKSGAKVFGLSVVTIGSVTDNALPCVLWEFAGSPLPATISQESLPALLSNVASALAVLQEQGWSHGDVSPGNIVISLQPDGSVAYKLVDYGFATKVGERMQCQNPDLLYCSSSQLDDNLAKAENDAESLLYVVLRLAGYVLPWETIVMYNDKAAVLHERKQFLLSAPQLPGFPEEVNTYVQKTCACLRGELAVAELLKETSRKKAPSRTQKTPTPAQFDAD